MEAFFRSKWLMFVVTLFSLLPASTAAVAIAHADAQLSTSIYQITIHTCNVGGAGTDGDVSVQLLADQWASSWATLDKSGYNDFEKNDWDTYDMSVAMQKPLSQLSQPKIKVKLTPSGSGPAWCMKYLQVREVATNIIWVAAPASWGDWYGAKEYCAGEQFRVRCQLERTYTLTIDTSVGASVSPHSHSHRANAQFHSFTKQ